MYKTKQNQSYPVNVATNSAHDAALIRNKVNAIV